MPSKVPLQEDGIRYGHSAIRVRVMRAKAKSRQGLGAFHKVSKDYERGLAQVGKWFKETGIHFTQ